jgi:glutathione S-transferase
LIYKKGLEEQINVVAPAALGGLKSPAYLALNPQGKMPLLVLPNGTAIPESQVKRSIKR